MASSPSEQFASLIRHAGESVHAHLCDGDRSAAVVWDDESEITIRLSLRGDEVWIIAGSGILVRFVAASDGEFDREAIIYVIDQILTGSAVEYFGLAQSTGDDVFATGFDIGPDREYASGLDRSQARFRAQLAGPLARATLTISD